MSAGGFQIRGETLKHVLAWSGLAEEALAKKLHVKAGKIRSWIAGETGPTWNQLEALAKSLNVPVPTFFGPPPDCETPLPDFRRGPKAGKKPSPDLLSLIYDAMRKQDWWKERVGASPSPLVGAIQEAMKPVDAGAHLRALLKLEEMQTQARTWDEFRRGLSNRLEEMGVLVLRRGHVRDVTNREIDPSEAAGFAIPDPAAPVLYINTRTYLSAQIFTLVHEVAHLALGQRALDDELETRDFPDERTERHCDSIAAEALVPADKLNTLWQGDPDAMARKFRVSTWVILRRALDLKLIRREEYDRMFLDYRQRIILQQKTKSGGSIAANIESWNGRRFTHAVMERLRDGDVTYTEAASLLWVSTKSLLAYLRNVQ